MKYLAVIYIFFLVALNIYLNDNNTTYNPQEYIYWANLLYWLFSFPLLIYILFGYRSEIYPFLGVVSLFLFFSYALPPFLIPVDYYQLGKLNIEALEWGFWGHLIFFSTYYILDILYKKTFPIYKPTVQYDLFEPRIKIVGYLFLAIYGCYSFFPIFSGLIHLSILSLYVYLYLFFVLINSKVRHINIFDRTIFYIVLINEYLKKAFDGLLAPIALFTLFIIIVDWSSRKERALSKILRVSVFSSIFLFIYLGIAPVKMEFRTLVWYSGETYSIADKLNLILDLREKYNFNSTIKTKKQEVESNFIWRYSYQASALSHVLYKTPSFVPFWNGESYIFFSKLIPRFLWPDKPKESMGYRFGVTYGIISPDNTKTSINTPIITEMYMNFGYYGIVFGMTFLGVLYFALNSYFNNKNISEFGKIFAIPIIFNLVSHESNFSLTFGNIPLILIGVYLIQLVLLGRKKYT